MNKQVGLDMSKLIVNGLQEARLDVSEAKVLVDRYLGVKIPSTQPKFNDKHYAQIVIHAIPPTNHSGQWSFVAFVNEKFADVVRFMLRGLNMDWYEKLRRANYTRPFIGNPAQGTFKASIGWLGQPSMVMENEGFATFTAEQPMSDDMAMNFVDYCSMEMHSMLDDYITMRKHGMEKFMRDVMISNSEAEYIERITKEVLNDE